MSRIFFNFVYLSKTMQLSVFMYLNYMTYTIKPRLSRHSRGKGKWPFNGGWLHEISILLGIGLKLT